MYKVKIIGGAMTPFGRHLDRNLKSLVAEAVNGALKDSGVTKGQLGGVWVGNASQGVLQGQESIRVLMVRRWRSKRQYVDGMFIDERVYEL
jgi:acetyl-CoA acetyltransferase